MPYCFEYINPNNNEKVFIEVVNTCTHHYTGEKMRYVREHWVDPIFKYGRCEYLFLNEASWQWRLEHRVKEATADTSDE
jgi:hypothetical protein